MKKKSLKEKSKLHGFFRLNVINPDGTVAGDTGWKKNVIVQTGYQQYLQFALIGSSGSKTATHAAFGTAGTPASTDATLVNQLTETAAKVPLTTGTIGSQTVQFTFTLSSGVIAAASTILNVGLYYYSNQSVVNSSGVMLAATNYASSSLATNQAVNIWRHLSETIERKLREIGGHLDNIFETIPSRALYI